jgi:hypothetical protein
MVQPTFTYVAKFYLGEWIVEDLGVIRPNLVKNNISQLIKIIQQPQQTMVDMNAMFTIS